MIELGERQDELPGGSRRTGLPTRDAGIEGIAQLTTSPVGQGGATAARGGEAPKIDDRLV